MVKLIEKLNRKGLHLTYADDFNFQLMPPLTIERKTLDQGLGIFIDLLNETK
jgi:4-aminobutyrate aminotransferase-like enzyme